MLQHSRLLVSQVRYVETTGNITYRWSGTGYVKITSGEVSSVAGKTGVVILSKADVGLANVDNTPDTQKPISAATQLALNNKVDKEAGKGLSTNDYSNTDKTKVSLITANGIGDKYLSDDGSYKEVSGGGGGNVLSVNGKTGAVVLNATDVGLANVSNIADSSKSVASASKLTTARTIGGVAFDGAANINLPGVNTVGNQSTTGNAATATKLQTVRGINGVLFDGTANITTVIWGTSRTLTIGSSGKAVNGGANVSWSLAEIGAAAASHTHEYLPTSGGTLSGNLDVTGTITATGTITQLSDARLKDNITKIPDALNKLNQLKGVTYTRKDITPDKKYAGLIAQDVQKVLPEAVAINEDEIISVDYNGVIGLLVEAIKELEAKVMHLEGK